MGPKNGDDFARERYEARAAAREGRQAQRDAAGAEARAKRAEAEASAVAEMAKVREWALMRLAAAGVADPVQLKKGTNLIASAHAGRKPGEHFDPEYEFRRALYTVTQRGLPPLDPRGAAPPSLPPVNASAGQPRQVMTAPVPPGAQREPLKFTPPTTRQELEEQRARYRERLRALGLLDPAFGSIPGGGGLTGGGPHGG